MPRLHDRSGLTATGMLRVGVGAALLARPATLPKALGVDSVTARQVRWLSAMLGARDLALGAGLVHAARTKRDPRPWLLAAAFSDAVDALAFGRAALRGDVGAAAGLLCFGAAATGVVAETASLRALQAQTVSVD